MKTTKRYATMNSFMTQLKKLNFVKYKNGYLIADNGIKLSMEYRTLKGGYRFIQVIFYLTYKGRAFMTWGGESAEQSYQLANFFEEAKAEVRRHEHETKDEFSDAMKQLFNQL